MSGQHNGFDAWWNRRARGARTFLGRTFGAVAPPDRPTVCLFCDFEGHHAGEDAGRFADAGTDRLLAMANTHRLPITFNVVAALCTTHPHRVTRLRDAGCEIACHGWQHESPRSLSPTETHAMLTGAINAFAALDIQPTGFRSPRSAWTMSLMKLLPKFHLRWSAERDPSWHAYRIAPTILRIPAKSDDWDLVDGTGDVASLFAKWDRLIDITRQRTGTIAIGIHEWIVGRNSQFAPRLEDWLSDLARDPTIRLCRIVDALPTPHNYIPDAGAAAP